MVSSNPLPHSPQVILQALLPGPHTPKVELSCPLTAERRGRSAKHKQPANSQGLFPPICALTAPKSPQRDQRGKDLEQRRNLKDT